jgi:flagellar biosynthesis protein FlhF
MIKKYRAKTVAEAYLRVKEELGPDAVILSQHELKSSSNPNEKVEVVATLDDISEVPPPAPSGKGKDTGKIATYNFKGIKPTAAPAKHSESKTIEYLENTLTEVKALREEFAATRNEFLEGVRVVRERIPREFNTVMADLVKNGVPAYAIQDLLAEVMLLCPAHLRDAASVKEHMKKVLANRVLIASRPRLRKGRPLMQMFIGPAGSGKSGIVSKLAGRATVTGNPNVAIVTTDCYRMGAIEQMEAFAVAADIEFEKVSSPEDVPEVFGRLRDKSLILIDTAGRSMKNEEHEEEIAALYEAIRPDEVHLVLPLNMRDRDLEKSAEKYAALKANRIIFTRLDEACENGALLWLPVKSGLPLSYIGNGQSPENILTAEKEIIADWLLK